MTWIPSFAPSSATASPIRRFRSSDSTTHGPAMRNGAAPPPAAKCCATSVASAGELRRPLGLGGGGGAAGAMLLARRAHEPGEQWVRPRGARLELRMELAADEPGVIGQLDHLDARAVGREAGAAHAVFGEDVAVGIGHFVAMPMPLADFERPVGLGDTRAGPQLARVGPQPHRPPQLLDPFLGPQQRNHRVLALRGELARFGIRELDHVARELDYRRLQAETDPEEGQSVLPRPAA